MCRAGRCTLASLASSAKGARRGQKGRHRRHDAALAAYRRIAAGSPYRLMADLRRADALDESGARTAAATLLRQLMARQEANPEPAIRLGDLFRGHKEWTDAIAAYDTAVARMEAGGKPYWSVYYARGIALERAKIWDRAEAACTSLRGGRKFRETS